MMKGSCDPGAEGTHEVTHAKAGGRVLIIVRWAWDGASLFPNCAGSVQSVRVVNATAQAWVADVPLSKKAKTLTADAGTDKTYSGAGQLKQIGLEVRADISDLRMRPI